MMTILSKLMAWATPAARPAPSRYDSAEFREWLAAQREPFALKDAALAAGFSTSELTRDNCMRTSIALQQLGFRRVERRDSGTRYWYWAPPGLLLEMPRRQAGFYNLDFTSFFVVLVAISVLIGALLTEALPWVWSLIKPWLHEVTR